MNVKIKAIELFDSATRLNTDRPREKTVGLAKFNAKLDHLTVKGCLLVRFPNGTISTWGPSVATKGEGVYFDDSLKHEITMAGKEAFLRLGGDPELLDIPDDGLIARPDRNDEWIEGLRANG